MRLLAISSTTTSGREGGMSSAQLFVRNRWGAVYEKSQLFLLGFPDCFSAVGVSATKTGGEQWAIEDRRQGRQC